MHFGDAGAKTFAQIGVRLNLFPGVVAESIVEWADLTANGYSWAGGVAGDPFGSAAMAVNGGVVHGSCTRAVGSIRCRGTEPAPPSFGRLSASPSRPRTGVPLPPRSAGPAERSGRGDPPDGVDIAVFYSPSVLQRERTRARGARADRFLDPTLNP